MASSWSRHLSARFALLWRPTPESLDRPCALGQHPAPGSCPDQGGVGAGRERYHCRSLRRSGSEADGSSAGGAALDQSFQDAFGRIARFNLLPRLLGQAATLLEIGVDLHPVPEIVGEYRIDVRLVERGELALDVR